MRLFVLSQLAYVSLRVSHYIPTVQLMTAHLTSLLSLNQHLRCFSVLLGLQRVNLPTSLVFGRGDFLSRAFLFAPMRTLDIFLSLCCCFLSCGFAFPVSKAVTIRESKVHLLDICISPTSSKVALVEVTASFPVAVLGIKWL